VTQFDAYNRKRRHNKRAIRGTERVNEIRGPEEIAAGVAVVGECSGKK